MRKFVGGEEKLNLYQIIIYQYILYQNPINSKDEEDKYRSELHNLLILLLSKISLNKEIHHYIFSILMNFSNKTTEKMYFQNNNNFHDESKINNHSEYLTRFLELLKIFYNFYNKLYDDDSIPNYFFFNGENSSSITIPNKENQKKNILNLEDTLCIMFFIKVFPSKIIKTLYPDLIQKLLEIRFNYKNLKNININIDIDNNLITNYTDKPLYQLSDNKINCIIIKLSDIKKNKIIITDIFVGKNKINPILIPYGNEEEEDEIKNIFDDFYDFEYEEKNNENNEKSNIAKDEITEIIFFQNFIGICSNIIIYKEKNNEGFPKFLELKNLNKMKQYLGDENNNNIDIKNSKISKEFHIFKWYL